MIIQITSPITQFQPERVFQKNLLLRKNKAATQLVVKGFPLWNFFSLKSTKEEKMRATSKIFYKPKN